MKILMVCLGNICRSPLAEGILRDKLSKKGIKGIDIDSAGTSNYHTGECPDVRSIENAKKHGIDISGLKARQFRPEDFDNFDRIYVMDAANLGDVSALIRNPEDREKIQMILNVSHPNSNMSVPDPYFGGEQGFENVYLLLDNACELIAENLKNKARG
jgi:protein-tyrosine phosphatase